MNIFILDANPCKAAEYHNDRHVVKMILESAQMLSTAHHESGVAPPQAYKSTHKNHPCNVWARATTANYRWLHELALELCAEYTRRYNKRHKTQDVIEALADPPQGTPNEPMTPFAQAMPDDLKHVNAVVAYRQYYRRDKANISTWKRGSPTWWEEEVNHAL
jgi:hypothetical protein